MGQSLPLNGLAMIVFFLGACPGSKTEGMDVHTMLSF